jgi:hypothetical protein
MFNKTDLLDCAPMLGALFGRMTTRSSFNAASVKGKQTFSLQSSLPRLPIPSLQDTGRRYLRSLEPLASNSELDNSTKNVNDFVNGFGNELHQRLKEYDKQQKYSWLEDIWLDRAYLLYREPIMINVNWYMVFNNNFDKIDDRRIVPELPYTAGQLKRCAVLSKLASDYKTMLDEGKVPIDVSKTGPLCMHQTQKMFGVTRIPELPKDRLVVDSKGDSAIVLIDDQIFVIKVLGESIKSIYSNLLQCVQELHQMKKRSPPIGILTTENRDNWAEQYKKIWELNKEQLEKINSSLFAICLDAHSPQTKHEAAALALHSVYGKNRWFDKCVEFFVCPNGIAGCNGEHSPCDAVIPNQLTTFILERYVKNSLIE